MDCDNYTAADIDRVVAELQIKDPDTNNDLSPAQPFNMMFPLQIGPSGYM